jgi:hypothetical protein
MIKVLFLTANPASTTKLALDEEIRAIDAKIRGAEFRDRLELVSHWAVRLDDLSGLLMRYEPDIVHFSGHGSSAGEVILSASSEAGNRDLIPPSDVGKQDIPSGTEARQTHIPIEALAGLFGVLKDKVRVVFLNACFSEVQAKAIVEHIDCAVGMSGAIRDDHAVAFASEFYQALAYGRSIQDAFDLGLVRLASERVADAIGLVKLHKRRGVNPSRIFLVGSRPGSAS